MELESIMLSEASQTAKDLTYIWNLKKNVVHLELI